MIFLVMQKETKKGSHQITLMWDIGFQNMERVWMNQMGLTKVEGLYGQNEYFK